MQKVTVRIIATSECHADSLELCSYAARLNDCYIDKGLYISIDQYSSADAVEEPVVIILLCTAGAPLPAASEQLFDSYRQTGKPRLLIYLREVPQAVSHAAALQERLEQESGLHCNSYQHVDSVRFGLLMLLNSMDLEAVNLRMDRGSVWQGNSALLSLDNVAIISGYEDLQNLKNRYAALDSCYYAAKAALAENPDDEAAHTAYYKAARERNTAMQEIRDIESQLYSMMAGMYEQTESGQLSRRQLASYRMTERGLLQEAREVLDFDSISGDHRRSEALHQQVNQ